MKNKKRKRIYTLLFIPVLILCIIGITTMIRRARVEEYYITQYGSASGHVNSMFYTIRDNYGHLAVIDGGWAEDYQTVANVIQSLGGHVDSWIITHPHQDHIGAFNEIYPRRKKLGITVDRIYATNVNTKVYKDKYDKWDPYENYGNFRKVVKGNQNVRYLKENDEFSIFSGLKAKVLHGWDQEVDSMPNDLPNHGSLVFKIYGKNESMLFCGDCSKEMEKSVVQRHKEELKSDYVQCAHHGNNAFSTDFYDLVKPKAAFLDGRKDLYINQNGWTGYVLVDYFKKAGVAMYNLDTAPNTIVLK